MNPFHDAAPAHVVVFDVEGRRFGLLARDVVEVVRAVAITPLPGAPGAVEGVFDLRGRLVPVLDIRTRFRLPAAALSPDQHFLVARAGPRLVALRASRAGDFVQVDPHEVDDVREVVPGVEYVVAAARLPDGVLLIHDPATFLTSAETADLDALLAAAPRPQP